MKWVARSGTDSCLKSRPMLEELANAFFFDVPTAAFGFTTLFNTYLMTSHWQTAVLFVLAYSTALLSSRVCIAVQRRLTSSPLADSDGTPTTDDAAPEK